jgi:Zn-dependent protease
MGNVRCRHLHPKTQLICAALHLRMNILMNPLLLGISAVVLHELSHVAAAYAQGLKVKRVGVTWKGPYIVREAGSRSQNLRVCLAGPSANLVLALLCWHVALPFAVCNLVLGAFNLLPIPGSDGQRAWQLLPVAAEARVPPASTVQAP